MIGMNAGERQELIGFPETELPPGRWAMGPAPPTGRSYRFRFRVGIARSRTVTVRAIDLDGAIAKARRELDRRAERQGREAPVAWNLHHDRRTGPRPKMVRCLVEPAPVVVLRVTYPSDGRYAAVRLVIASTIAQKLILTHLNDNEQGVEIGVLNITDEAFVFHGAICVSRASGAPSPLSAFRFQSGGYP